MWEIGAGVILVSIAGAGALIGIGKLRKAGMGAWATLAFVGLWATLMAVAATKLTVAVVAVTPLAMHPGDRVAMWSVAAVAMFVFGMAMLRMAADAQWRRKRKPASVGRTIKHDYSWGVNT